MRYIILMWKVYVGEIIVDKKHAEVNGMPFEYEKCSFRPNLYKGLMRGSYYVEYDNVGSRVGDDGEGNIEIFNPTGFRGWLCKILRKIEKRLRRVGRIDYDNGNIRLNRKWVKNLQGFSCYYIRENLKK